jgi:hypothetical protein
LSLSLVVNLTLYLSCTGKKVRVLGSTLKL